MSHRHRKTLGRASLVAAVVGLTLSVGASSALAGASAPPPYKEYGTLTLKVNGGSPVTCQIDTSNTGGFITTWYLDTGLEPCAGGTRFRMYVMHNVSSNGATYLPWFQNYNESPWGQWNLEGFSVPVTNGNATTPTKITFNNTPLGYTPAGLNRITATGTLNFTTMNGGLVTFTP